MIEESGEALIITDRGRPVLKVTPYAADAEERLKILRNSVLKYASEQRYRGADNALSRRILTLSLRIYLDVWAIESGKGENNGPGELLRIHW